MPQQIRTLVRHEDVSPSVDKERGSRYWSAAEIMSSVWFVVEASVEVSGRFELRRWVTTSIGEAAQIQRGQDPFNWSRVFVCMRAPFSVRDGTVFEVVKDAYQSQAGGAYVYHLANGMTFRTENEQVPRDPEAPEELTLVYAHRR